MLQRKNLRCLAVMPSSSLSQDEWLHAQNSAQISQQQQLTVMMPSEQDVVLLRSTISDQQRLRALDQIARVKPEYLWALRGGWGSARVLKAWPQPSPPIVGFSDVTSLLWATKAIVRGFHIHGPTLSSFASEPLWSQQRLMACMRGESLPALSGTCLVPGQATGPCWVGNLTVATHLLGTAYMPHLAGAIVVFEDVNEPLYKIDRMLTQWQLSGQLALCAGFGFGRFDGQVIDGHRESLNHLLYHHLAPLGKPVMTGLPIGHGSQGNAAIPIAQSVTINCGAVSSTLEVLST